MKNFSRAAIFVFVSLFTTVTQASVVYTFADVGGGVQVDFAGSLNVGPETALIIGSNFYSMRSGTSTKGIYAMQGVQWRTDQTVPFAPSPSWMTSGSYSGAGTGNFGFITNTTNLFRLFFSNAGYTANDALAGSLFFSGISLSSIGFTDYSIDLGEDVGSLIFTSSAAVVPEINGAQLGIALTLLFSLILLYREREGLQS